mmetsp:Transcript_84966/g.240904  ORF Transcript_84966/g.240904 Transcript_84966/m.240904 type:complete len:266 (+) Transcript_84966:508-1305(+)
MSDDSTTTPEIAGEMEELDEEEKSGSTTGTVAISAANSFRERLSGAPETNLVAEFTFFASLAEKTKQDTNVPTTRELQAQVPNVEELSGVLADAHLKKGLRYFCNEETNMENLLFYEQVELYRRGTESQAKKLCKAFVREGSPSELNITSKQRADLVGAIDGKDAHRSDVFDEAQKEILSIMAKDIFPRFMQSPVCRGLLHSRVNSEFGTFVKEGFESTKAGGATTSPAPSSPSLRDRKASKGSVVKGSFGFGGSPTTGPKVISP